MTGTVSGRSQPWDAPQPPATHHVTIRGPFTIACEDDRRGSQFDGPKSLEKLLVWAGMHAGVDRRVAEGRAAKAMRLIWNGETP